MRFKTRILTKHKFDPISLGENRKDRFKFYGEFSFQEENRDGIIGLFKISLRRLLMAHLFERITINPEQCGGRPCIRGMRIRVIDVLELYAAGLTPEQILEEMPDLEMEDLHASLRYAAHKLDHPVLTI